MPTEFISILDRREQTASAWTHGFGALMVLVGFPFLLVATLPLNSLPITFGVGIFLISLFMVYASSAVYHYFYFTEKRHFLRTIDHICIYFLIAGTNTPFIFMYHKVYFGTALMLMFWTAVLIGMIYKLKYTGKYEWFSLSSYIFLGWMGVVTMYPIIGDLSNAELYTLLGGGFFYTLGTYFYSKDDLPYNHTIWHLFVMGGSICHFYAVYYAVFNVMS